MRGGWIGASLLPLLFSGCVERFLLIRSDPPGAEVFINGTLEGVTPLQWKFDYYGDYEITLRKARFQTVRKVEPIEAPWWQIFPFDFVTDVLSPFHQEDARELSYALAPLGPPQPADDVRQRAEEMRRRLEQKSR